MRVLLLLLVLCRLDAAWEQREAVVTAYTPSVEGGGAGTGRTATNTKTSVHPYGVASDWGMLPPGSIVIVPGYEHICKTPTATVDDTGAAMRADARRGVLHIDLRMRTLNAALHWGVQNLTILVWNPDKP